MTIAVFALGDDQNNPPGAGMHALVSPPPLSHPFSSARSQALTRTVALSTYPGTATDDAEVLPGVQHGVVVESGVGLRAPLGGVAGGLPRT